MPRLPAIPLPVLRTLEAQLRHAPRETLLRDVERVEELAQAIDADQNYPHDWIVFRVTGFRPDDAPAGAVPGRDLLAALSPFAEGLCVRAGLRAEELDARSFIRASVLAQEWSASTATFKRWRRAGLVTRRATSSSGADEVWVSRLCAEHFRTAHAHRLDRARSLKRLSPEQREEVITQALHAARAGASLHAAARTIAERTGRSVEGVKHVLRADARTRRAFPGRPSRPARDPRRRRHALLRLWRGGADPASLARLVAKGVPLVRREINLARAESLRSWLDAGALSCPALDALMPHASMPCSFSPPRPATALLSATLAEWRTRHPLPKATEHALALAFHSLRAHAAERARHLDHLHPSAHALDDAETALRHASLLRAALVHSTHRLILETLEARAALPLDRLLPALAVRLLRDATTAASQALEHFDPGKGGRLAGPVGLAVDRAAVRTLRDALPPRASTRAVVLQPDTLLDLPPLSPWDRSLTPDPRIARAVALGPKDDPRLSLLADRFGLGALPPRTLAQIRASRGRTAIAVARDLQRALAHCLRNNPA